VHNTDIHPSFDAAAAAGIFNAWNRAKNTIYNLAQRSPHREQQQHDREQQQKDQEWRRFLLSRNDYDREDIIISIDDDVSAMSSSPSTSSTLGEGNSSSNDHNQENPTTPMKKKQQEKRNKIVSFRLSERDYERHLSMAKLCYENGLTKGPDIVSYIRLSMDCLWHYINNNSQARAVPSAEEKKEEKNRQQPQKKQEGGVEQDVNYHTMTASSSRATTTTNTAMGENTRESIAITSPLSPPPTPPLFNNLHEYFKPVFDQLDELNRLADSHIGEEKNNPKRKRNDDSTVKTSTKHT
jgi:hypothetical protein